MQSIWLLSFVTFILLAQSQALALPSALQDSHNDETSTSNALQLGVHYKPDGYHFSARDGWMQYETRNVLDFSAHWHNDNQSLHSHSPPVDTLNDIRSRISEPRSKPKPKSKIKSKSNFSNGSEDGSSHKALGGTISGVLRGIGDAIKVVITWYSGHDLENPSCWSDSVWTPTDDSHVCAVTLDGWAQKPKCFDFLELCLGRKCVFVRVVDTCAGCAAGSRHVDLTKAAFSALGSLDTGVMNVQMRKATTPTSWDTELYGPKH